MKGPVLQTSKLQMSQRKGLIWTLPMRTLEVAFLTPSSTLLLYHFYSFNN